MVRKVIKILFCKILRIFEKLFCKNRTNRVKSGCSVVKLVLRGLFLMYYVLIQSLWIVQVRCVHIGVYGQATKGHEAGMATKGDIL